MLISEGVNVYPRKIEEALYAQRDILDVALIGIPGPVWGESVKSAVVLREETTLTDEDSTAYCEGKIASYKRPMSVDFVKELPRNPPGRY
ncbi:MAG: AMP-binding enzyme [Bacillota bacterium]